MLQWAEHEERPTAVFAQNDQMAVGVLRAARDLGIRIPEQLSVIGTDNIPLAQHLEPPLTTVHQDFAAIGREAARLLVRAMTHPEVTPEHLRLLPQLVLRKTTCRQPALGHVA